MPGKIVSVTGLGDLKQLEDAFRKAGLTVSETADKMAASAQKAGAAAAQAAKEQGASVDEQIASAGRAAAAFSEMQAKYDASQRAAGASAAAAAKSAGLSADAQEAAYTRSANAAKKSAESHKALEDTHKKVSKLGGTVLLGGTAALAAGGIAVIKLGEDFQTAQAKIQGATGQSTKAVEAMTAQFRHTSDAAASGQQMEAAFSEVAEQLKVTEGHALQTGEAMKVVAAGNHLAESTATPVNQAYGALAKTMQAFHMSAGQAGQASDVLFSTSKALNVPIETIATSMAKLHSRLGDVAPSLADVGGLMVSLGEHGVTGSRGTQVVNTAFQTLLGGSTKVTETLKALGVSVYNSNGQFIGLKGVIAELQPKLEGMNEQTRHYVEQTLFGKGAAEILGQVVKGGVPAFEQATDAATRHNAALKAAEAQAHTLRGEVEQLRHGLETLGGSIGLSLIPKITALGHALAEGIQWFERHKAAAIALAGVIASVLGAAVAVFVYDKVVAFGEGLTRMASGLSGLAQKMTGTAGTMKAEGGVMVDDAEATSAGIDTALGATGVGLILVGLGTVATELVTHWESVMHAMESVARSMANAVVSALNEVINLFNETVGKLTGTIGKIEELHSAKERAEVNKQASQENLDTGAQWTTNPNGPTPAWRSVTSLENLGLGSSAAQGVVKALMAESKGNLVKGAATEEEGGGGGYGVAQWTGSRRGGLEKFAKSKHEPVSNLEVQLEYLAKELEGPEKATLKALQHAHGVNEASALFIKGFEKPENASEAEGRAKGYSVSSSKELQEQMEVAEGKKEATAANEKKKTAAALGVPVGVATMLSTAQALLGTKYTRGGGHGESTYDPIAKLKQIGVDCSGFVSRVLSSGGLSVAGLTTEELASSSSLAKGAGKYVTVYDRPSGSQAHTIIDILGKYFESGGNPQYNPKGGVSLLTAAQAKGELSGGGFVAYHPGGKLNEAVKGGESEATLKAGTTAAEAVASTLEKTITKLDTSAAAMLGEKTPRGSFAAANQSGTVPSLEKILGVTTAGTSGKQLAQLLSEPFTQGKLEHHIMPLLSKAAGTTGTGREFNQTVSELRSVGQNHLANELVQAHKQALANLGRELYAIHQEKMAQLVTAEATEEKDRTQLASDVASAELQVTKDNAERQTDAVQAATKQIEDATQKTKDSMAAAAEAIQLAAQEMSDVGSGEVQAIQDQTAIAVAKLEERGKYGLELVAQKLEVQLDQMKASYDIEIQHAKIAEDQAKIAGQSLVAQKQQSVDLLSAHTDAVIAGAQAHLDTERVAQDQLKVQALEHVDSVQLAADLRDDNAKLAEVLVAGGTKAQQDAAKAFSASATAPGQKEVEGAKGGLAAVERSANALIAAAENNLKSVEVTAAQALAEAKGSLARAEGESKKTLAEAEAAVSAIETNARKAEAKIEGQISEERARSQTQYAGSGLVINQYGLNPSDAAANAAELGWALRTMLPA